MEERDEDVEPTEIVQKEPQRFLCLAVLALLSCFPFAMTFGSTESMRDPEDFSVVLYVSSLFTLFVYVTFASGTSHSETRSSDVVSSANTKWCLVLSTGCSDVQLVVCESGFSDNPRSTRVTVRYGIAVAVVDVDGCLWP